jgi:hypothetical protein
MERAGQASVEVFVPRAGNEKPGRSRRLELLMRRGRRAAKVRKCRINVLADISIAGYDDAYDSPGIQMHRNRGI